MLAHWVARFKHFYDELGKDDTRPPFIYNTNITVPWTGPEGVAVTVIDFCKAWACTRRTVAFLDLEMISGLLKRYEAYWDELNYVMQHVDSWEDIGYLPRTYANLLLDYQSLIANPTIPPSRTWNIKGEGMMDRIEADESHEAPFSALFIFYVKKILELHEEGFEDRWFEMWERWRPVPGKYRLFRFPRDIPVSESELDLKKKSEGVHIGQLLSEP
ncbi:hypothetical protein IAR50_001584 [Cryptococcus sp. DSM 104548]